MPKSSKTKSAKKRVKVDKLAGKPKRLSKKEAKDVKGGILIGLLLPVKGQLSGTPQGNTVGGALGPISGNTIGGSLAGNISNPSKP